MALNFTYVLIFVKDRIFFCSWQWFLNQGAKDGSDMNVKVKKNNFPKTKINRRALRRNWTIFYSGLFCFILGLNLFHTDCTAFSDIYFLANIKFMLILWPVCILLRIHFLGK
jgi:hypothetical protein